MHPFRAALTATAITVTAGCLPTPPPAPRLPPVYRTATPVILCEDPVTHNRLYEVRVTETGEWTYQYLWAGRQWTNGTWDRQLPRGYVAWIDTGYPFRLLYRPTVGTGTWTVLSAVTDLHTTVRC